jgi:hypothetical protein
VCLQHIRNSRGRKKQNCEKKTGRWLKGLSPNHHSVIFRALCSLSHATNKLFPLSIVLVEIYFSSYSFKFLNRVPNVSKTKTIPCSFRLLACLEMWLWLFFKVFFTRKCIKMMSFYFLKIIFDINVSKWSENTKKILI